MTDHYAVFGNPLGHTKSPQIHTAFAAEFGEDMTYGKVEAPLDGFEDSVRAFFAEGGMGLNVTVPFKVEAYDLADQCLPAAAICGASNCLKIENGQILADNFDGAGLLRDVEKNLGVPVSGARILLLGAGGAARGTIVPFLQGGAESITIANRSLRKAETLCEQLGGYGSLTPARLDDVTDSYDIVLNSTSASLTGAEIPISDSVYSGARLAYDLVYGKGKTPFLAHAERAGAEQIADGVGMLVEQAAEAFVWWRGKRPDTAPVIKDLTIPLV